MNRFLSRLRRSRSGIAMTEFALGMPVLLVAGLWGVELANYAITNMRVSQLAMQIADNASRTTDTSVIEDRKLFEADINDLLVGANLQAGDSLDLFEHGRVIISSVEVWNQSYYCGLSGGSCPGGAPAEGQQFIHWQRCKGKKVHNPQFGHQNAALPRGIGPTGYEVFAPDDGALIFVEIAYDYQPLVSSRFVGNPTISAIASFVVRDDRDRSGVKQRNPGSPDRFGRRLVRFGFGFGGRFIGAGGGLA